MTAREKLKLDHPDWDDKEIAWWIDVYCPNEYGLEYPVGDFDCADIDACDRCWDREIPGSKKEKSVSNKLGSIELGVEVHQCRDCDKGRNVLYLCDGLACGKVCPNPECKHTTDIRHAKNFKSSAEMFLQGHCVSSNCDSFWEINNISNEDTIVEVQHND